jgi:hypothetical protein
VEEEEEEEEEEAAFRSLSMTLVWQMQTIPHS